MSLTMHLSNEIDAFIERLKACDGLKACKIVKAFPYITKPTILKNPVIAVSCATVQAECVELGGEEMCGSFKICASIFLPTKNGSAGVYDLVANVLGSQAGAYPCAVSVGEINADNELDCLNVECVFDFPCAMNLGEDDYE